MEKNNEGYFGVVCTCVSSLVRKRSHSRGGKGIFCVHRGYLTNHRVLSSIEKNRVRGVIT